MLPQDTLPEAPNGGAVAPAAMRNRGPILAILEEILPSAGTVLELASGTGQHIVYFAAALPGLRWVPSDPEPAARDSIAAWCRAAELRNVAPPLALDARATDWPLAEVDAILCINMIHISPWSATQGLLQGAARILTPGGCLYLYGPYRIGGGHHAPSNVAFDESLRRRDPAWGVRDLEAVIEAAAAVGLVYEGRIAMPANNWSVVFRKPQGRK